MDNTADRAKSDNITDLDFVTRVRPGIIRVDMDRVRARRVARGADIEADLKCSGMVKADFVPDQEDYKYGLYDE